MRVSFAALLLIVNIFVSRLHIVRCERNDLTEMRQLYQQHCSLRITSKNHEVKTETLYNKGTRVSSIIQHMYKNQTRNLQIPQNLKQNRDMVTIVPKPTKNVFLMLYFY